MGYGPAKIDELIVRKRPIGITDEGVQYRKFDGQVSTMRFQGVDQPQQKKAFRLSKLAGRKNKHNVLREIVENGPIGTPDIVKALGISSAVVDRWTARLMDENMIVMKGRVVGDAKHSTNPTRMFSATQRGRKFSKRLDKLKE